MATKFHRDACTFYLLYENSKTCTDLQTCQYLWRHKFPRLFLSTKSIYVLHEIDSKLFNSYWRSKFMAYGLIKLFSVPPNFKWRFKFCDVIFTLKLAKWTLVLNKHSVFSRSNYVRKFLPPTFTTKCLTKLEFLESLLVYIDRCDILSDITPCLSSTGHFLYPGWQVHCGRGIRRDGQHLGLYRKDFLEYVE